MRRRRRRTLLVPEARAALDQLRDAVVVEQSRSLAPYQPRDNGELTTRQAGKIGGAIGGSMISRLVAIAEQELIKEKPDHGPQS
ncbi:MAG: hypothetical protein A2201_10505 [Alicyclobacillus sp. RIFOXYA1_FULL_53_8]|nr:MAG: hypothetical protein A2201_10505 [Alicyclobacillus sp. RIFOXYA1_FULL_53_8]